MHSPVHVIGMPGFDPKLRVDARMPPNMSVNAHLAIIFPRANATVFRRTRVTLDGQVIPRCFWDACRPKKGTLVCQVVPGQSQILRNVLMIAASVAAAAVGQMWLAPALASTFGATGASILGAAGAAALSIGPAMSWARRIPEPRTGTARPRRNFLHRVLAVLAIGMTAAIVAAPLLR